MNRNSEKDEISKKKGNGELGTLLQCKSTDVGRYFYGLWSPGVADSATIMAVNCNLLIPGGCAFSETNPKYRCNRCNYKWGNFK